MSILADALPVGLYGATLTLPGLVAVARGSRSVSVAAGAMSGLDRAREALLRARDAGTVYGANTGVGANRNVRVEPESGGDAAGMHGTASGGEDDGAEHRTAHARRLLLSHCAGAGPVEDDAVARGTMAVRLNQFLAGGSGISSGVAGGLLDALVSDSLPTLHRLGSIGMGDLPPLAELALTLSGDRPWQSGGIDPVHFTDSDALPFMSSSAVTLAAAALGTTGLQSLLRSSVVVAALSLLALEGSPEAYSDGVHSARPHPYQREIAAEVRRLTGMDTGSVRRGARIQDPFGLRVYPQVHAPAVESVWRLVRVLEQEINAAAENPLAVAGGVAHHGQFHLAALAAAQDSARTAVYPVLTLSAARLGMLFRPDMTGLPAFLAQGAAGSSGLMIAEYVVQDVLSEVRTAAAPVSGASVSVSLGLEDHASFATQGARLLRQTAETAPIVIAVEAVAAVRALRLAPGRLGCGPAREAFEYLAAGLGAEMDDRPLGEDIEKAVALLPGLCGFLGSGFPEDSL